jgi:putative hemolysin
VGGFLMAALGRLAVIGDEVPVPGDANPVRPGGGWLLRVLALDGRRVARVAVVPTVPALAEAREAAVTRPVPAVGGAPVLPREAG